VMLWGTFQSGAAAAIRSAAGCARATRASRASRRACTWVVRSGAPAVAGGAGSRPAAGPRAREPGHERSTARIGPPGNG
jgi:hypothetical protein